MTENVIELENIEVTPVSEEVKVVAPAGEEDAVVSSEEVKVETPLVLDVVELKIEEPVEVLAEINDLIAM